MLLEFSCSNHKSIKDKITFSAIAGKDETLDDQLIYYGKYKVLKTAVIYGPNGSGKSNLIDAIQFTKNMVVESIKHQPGDGIRQINHKLKNISDPSEYTIQFVKNDIRYAYGFVLNNALVYEEYLYYFPKGRQVKIFERTTDAFKPGDKFKGKFDTCQDVMKPNRLLLSCAANFSNVSEVNEAFAFFRDDLIVYKGLGVDNWMDYSLHKIHDDPEVKKIALLFLDSLGTGITDIKVNIDKDYLKVTDLPPFLADEFKIKLMSEKMDRIEAKVVYESFETDLMNDESLGIKKLFEFVCPMIDIMANGKVLVCDELEANFHESIVLGLVELFRTVKTSEPTQWFFTTHDTSILSLSLFRRDQIWFTELTKGERATDLYSLTEIKNVRKDENIGKGYISGKYGAIPMLNTSLASLIEGGIDGK